jgi:hypothetical protein
VEERLERLQRVSKKSRTELDEAQTQLADLKQRLANAEVGGCTAVESSVTPSF